MPKKQKIKIREIKPKIKITEIEQEEEKPVEKEAAPFEESLEEITSDAPSSRMFPAVPQNIPQGIEAPPQQEEREATEERTSPRYEVQKNVTEQSLRKEYDLQESEIHVEARNIAIEPHLERGGIFENKELTSLRESHEKEPEEKYHVVQQAKHSPKRRYPWEA